MSKRFINALKMRYFSSLYDYCKGYVSILCNRELPETEGKMNLS